MAKPQQPELRRSGHIPALNPDAAEGLVEAQDVPTDDDPMSPVPDENRRTAAPSTARSLDEDKPDPDAFAESLGLDDDRREDQTDRNDERDEGDRNAGSDA